MNRWLLDDFSRLGVRQWWEAVGRATLSQGFGAAIDELVAGVAHAPAVAKPMREAGL